MKKFSLLAALAVAMMVSSTASAQTKRPILDREVAEKATPVQQEAFAGCIEAALKECPMPVCKADTMDKVQQCHAELGRCQAEKIKVCSRHLAPESR
jgi:uncharacterized low-complexity protein